MTCSTTAPPRSRELVGSGCSRNIDCLRDPNLELLEIERPVVERRREPESKFDQIQFSRTISVVHPANLRNRGVALVDEHQRRLGQIVEQSRGRFSGLPARQVPGVVLNPAAVADSLDHLQVKHRALVHALGLQKPAFLFPLRAALLQLRFDGVERLRPALFGDDIVRLRVDGNPVVLSKNLSSERVELRDSFDFISEELDSDGVVIVRRHDLDDVSPHPKSAPFQSVVSPFVLDLDEFVEDLSPADSSAAIDHQQHAVIGLGRAQAVNAAHTADDDAVTALEERTGR